MNINYQIIAATADDGKYHPDYDALISAASCEEEAEYINEVKERSFAFSYNMVYVARQACGHFEIFQSPQNEHYPINQVLGSAAEHAAIRKCTHCICNPA